MNKQYILALDLKDNPELIAAYEDWHQKVWPEILDSIKQSGIEKMEIYRVGNRLMMIMEVNNHFDFAAKATAEKVEAERRGQECAAAEKTEAARKEQKRNQRVDLKERGFAPTASPQASAQLRAAFQSTSTLLELKLHSLMNLASIPADGNSIKNQMQFLCLLNHWTGLFIYR